MPALRYPAATNAMRQCISVLNNASVNLVSSVSRPTVLAFKAATRGQVADQARRPKPVCDWVSRRWLQHARNDGTQENAE
jgi:hypothetical protein